jgi:NADP-dependent aldehyde dehydrogenase
MKLTGKQIIGFSNSQRGSREFHGLNASTGEVVGPSFFEATIDEVDAALALAKAAFPKYRRISDLDRAQFLLAIIDEINAIGDDLIKTACLESGLPEARITGERGRTTGQIKAFADFISNEPALPDRQPLPKPDLLQKQIPLGPSVIFGASNFPLAFSVAGGDTMSALAAGCPVVFKAHPAHPNTCELMGTAIIKAAQKTHMPEGVFSMVHATSHEIGGYLVTHPITQAVGFTGSYRGGKALYDLAVRRPQPIPVYAEMGSINPVVLLSEKIKIAGEALADGLSQSVCMGVGQFCTNPGLLILLKSDEGFLDLVASRLNTMPLGTFLTKGIKDAYTHGTKSLVGHASVQQLTVATLPSPALFKTSAKEAMKNPEVLEEVFGPSTLAVVAENMEEMIDFIDQLPGQLTATIQGELNELGKVNDLIEALTQKVGRILLNGFPTGVEVSGAMVHGGPFPSTTDSRSTSVGTQAIYRFTRPVCFQNFSKELIP